ncbi:MAG: fused MFS/spermidine synthase [Verrucomicrobia bacterium]|nr:fused MFS/spermidine synthase [Verrucomicrobiota bacterium]
MKKFCLKIALFLAAFSVCAGPLPAAVVFEAHSPYHHVQVLDERGTRTLSFNGTQETRMSLTDPLQGHFEYTEFFHVPWVWNRDIKRVLALGLGGGSIQRAYQHYYTNVMLESVEMDPVVIQVAKEYFHVKESPTHKIHHHDGRTFLQRGREAYDVILVDAYTSSRYGSSIPPHLVTREFFAQASVRLSTNGVLAYNVIGQLQGGRADIIGALYRTMKEVFPHVYLFPASSSLNVVMVATKSAAPYDYARVQRDGAELIRSGKVKLPTFATRLRAFQDAPPRNAAISPVLTDDRAPVESLMRGTGFSN